MTKKNVALILLLGFLIGYVACDLSRTFIHAQDESSKGPKWVHAHELRVRKSGETDFSKTTKSFGIEVFKDQNNGNLIYICETGDISVVPAK